MKTFFEGETALIGHTGFVGSNLARQNPFGNRYNSSNIQTIRGRKFDLVVCAGIQAKKWWANQHAEEDLQNIDLLLDCLSEVSAATIVLISTVDVYPQPKGVTEQTPIDCTCHHAYGKNRFAAEEFVRQRFPRHLILRLPGLFGDGIKKNVVHDFMADHELEKINPEGVYQYYFLDRLRADMEKALEHDLSLLNLACEPLGTRELMRRFFPEKTVGPAAPFSADYDMLSEYWKTWSSTSAGYLYSKDETLDQLGEFFRRNGIST